MVSAHRAAGLGRGRGRWGGGGGRREPERGGDHRDLQLDQQQPLPTPEHPEPEGEKEREGLANINISAAHLIRMIKRIVVCRAPDSLAQDERSAVRFLKRKLFIITFLLLIKYPPGTNSLEDIPGCVGRVLVDRVVEVGGGGGGRAVEVHPHLLELGAALLTCGLPGPRGLRMRDPDPHHLRDGLLAPDLIIIIIINVIIIILLSPPPAALRHPRSRRRGRVTSSRLRDIAPQPAARPGAWIGKYFA